MLPSHMQCMRCAFGNRVADDLVECRVNPPTESIPTQEWVRTGDEQPDGSIPGRYVFGRRPQHVLVPPDHWCGKWKSEEL